MVPLHHRDWMRVAFTHMDLNLLYSFAGRIAGNDNKSCQSDMLQDTTMV